MRPVTGRHLLAPHSHTRLSNSFPCGLPALFRCIEISGGESGLPRSQSCRHNMDFVVPVRLAPVFPLVALTATYSQLAGEHPATHLLVRAFQQLWLINCHGGCPTVHLRCACGTCLAPTPHGCWQCRFPPCRQGEPSSEGCFVPGASNPIVANRARPDRQLLVVQQVTFRKIPNVTRQERALPSTTLPIYVRRTALRVARHHEL